MTKKWIFIVLSFLAAVVASILVYQYLVDFFTQFVLDSQRPDQVRIEVSPISLIKLYLQCFFFFFMLMCLPFIFSAFAVKWKIAKHNLWISIIALEAVGITLILATAPPDMISRMTLFILWQLPVGVNFIVLWVLVTKNQKESQ